MTDTNFTSNFTIAKKRIIDDPFHYIAYVEFDEFSPIHNGLIRVLNILETIFLAAGFLGNLLAFITLLRSRQMQTPSFVYHKALVCAYLVYCLNYLVVKVVTAYATVPGEIQKMIFYNPLTAYYSIILNRVVSSVCGYAALYTSLAISVDRFLALVIFKHYAKFNRRPVAYYWVGISLFLSVCAHSWAPWLEKTIQTEVRNATNGTGRARTLYRDADSSENLKPYIAAKDWYNLMVRFAYAILLTALTIVVIYMFARQQKKRSTLCNVSKRQLRKERSLFYLMIAVVILAYIQVIPKETKRVLEMFLPKDYLYERMQDAREPLASRRWYLMLYLYGYELTTPILNFCSVIERSMLFYLYFALNYTFRKELLTWMRLRRAWRAMSNICGCKTVSMETGSSRRAGSTLSNPEEFESSLKAHRHKRSTGDHPSTAYTRVRQSSKIDSCHSEYSEYSSVI